MTQQDAPPSSGLQLFDVLHVLDPDARPSQCKIHLAGWTGKENPLDEYFAGTFHDWQTYQSKKNFKCSYVLSLISLPERNLWLFAGLFTAKGCRLRKKAGRELYRYSLSQRPETKCLDGRLIVRFARSGRQSYLKAARWENQLHVHEIRPERMTIGGFPGYSKVRISKSQLDLIVNQGIADWKGALSSVSGVYLITDTRTGKLYVGKATGEGGIWRRWCSYAENGHGGNKLLRKVLRGRGQKYSNNFQFSILETADTHANEDDISARESHWKNVLLTRDFGYNDN